LEREPGVRFAHVREVGGNMVSVLVVEGIDAFSFDIRHIDLVDVGGKVA